MLKIVYRVCCGMDVHKSFVVACIASTNEYGVTTYKSKRFSTFTRDLRRCADWLSENNCKDVCMESTGKYWIPIYNILEPTCNVVLAHPKYVKAIRARKRQTGCQVDRRHFQARPCRREFYPTSRYSPTTGFGTLPLETHQLYYRREKPGTKLSDGLQFQTG